ncbi:MAG: hypothetical protein U5K84_10575 [Alkalibacterium sp.]|nr:hypothetical protein [Alkalibacterium sp.]
MFDHIEKLRVNGRKTARDMYGCRGFTAHHNTDIWGDTAPQDIYLPATIWPMGAAWLCLHYWEHYLFSKDIEFLRDRYETMKEAALFFVDHLIENKDGYLVTSPSVFPENTYIMADGTQGMMCEGPAMDSQIIGSLFTGCIKASEILDTDPDFRQMLFGLKDRLPPIKIGRHGQIQEWLQDYEEEKPGHRHISQLFALYPGHQLTGKLKPELMEAAKQTLFRRLKYGGAHTGWSRAWIINLFARLLEAEQAYTHLVELLKLSTLPNLLDNHPPFQIDGNFGGTAGIAEMLLQSHDDCLHVLPALPEAWKSGKIRGVRARAGIQWISGWDSHQLKYCQIHVQEAGLCRIRSGIPLILKDNTKTDLRENQSGRVCLQSRKRDLYVTEDDVTSTLSYLG